MLATIEFEEMIAPLDVAAAIQSEWGTSKVVHVKRPFSGNERELRGFYDSVLEALGKPVEIGEDATSGDRDNQRTGERWMEIRYDPTIPDAYRHSANPQPLHTDGSYIPDFPDAAIIYCQASASNGGETVFLDSEILLQALKTEAPDLLEQLTSNVVPHARSGDQRNAKIIADDGLLHWNYYCVAKDVDEAIVALSEKFHQFLQESPIIQSNLNAVSLRPGDCVIWKDYETLHGRNGFDPTIKSERFLWKSAVHVNS